MGEKGLGPISEGPEPWAVVLALKGQDAGVRQPASNLDSAIY